MLNSWRRQKVDGDETLDLKFFPLDDMPPLFCKQHEDCLQDLLEKRVGYIVNIKEAKRLAFYVLFPPIIKH